MRRHLIPLSFHQTFLLCIDWVICQWPVTDKTDSCSEAHDLVGRTHKLL